MTVLLELKDVFKEFQDKVILDKVNLKINDGERIALVGSNGCGKTTFANIISGAEDASGNITWYKDNVKIGYMKQTTNYEHEYKNLSGGEKTKKLLSKVFYSNYDFLILDEPTNHLDYLGVSWLIKCIKEFKGTILIISHDRYFLDNTVKHIVEIEKGNLTDYPGNYTWYRQKKKKDYENALNAYIQQEKIKENINNQINKLSEWSKKGHADSTKKPLELGEKFGVKEFFRARAKKKDKQVKSKLKRLEKMKVEGIEKPKEEEKITFSIDNAKKIGSVVVRAENISKSYGNKLLFKNASFYIKHKEKIALYGINGCGKTTLIKALLGKEELEGNLYLSHNVKVGYISQEVIGLDEESTIIELFSFTSRQELGDIRTKLNLLGFNKDSLNKKVKVLSMGERMKLKILLMIKERCDVLILDEPTNHIDIHVREKLEEILEDYNGSIILVTHDRYMIEKVCNKLLVFENNNITRFEYGISEYLSKKKNKFISKKSHANHNKEDKMILDNKITCVIGKLSLCKPGSEEYIELENEYNKLIDLKCRT